MPTKRDRSNVQGGIPIDASRLMQPKVSEDPHKQHDDHTEQQDRREVGLLHGRVYFGLSLRYFAGFARNFCRSDSEQK